jgi:ribosomal protein L11 methyltransferase
MVDYLELAFDLRGLDAEAVEAACFEAGALAVTFTNAAGNDANEGAVLEPQPGEVRLWTATRVQALYERARGASALNAALAAHLGIEPARLSVAPIAQRVWEREWLRDFHAMRFGERLWIRPQHESVHQQDAVIVELDPGLAFGTGTHASTALCLEWLDAAAGERAGHGIEGCGVVDYGCGSGVLAIAALKLGARWAYAFDHDPQALLATRENAARNAVSERVSICPSAADIPPGCNALLANILAAVLIEHAPRFAALVCGGGQLLLSGILVCEESEVAAAFTKWFHMRVFAVRDGWVALHGTRY